MLSAGACLDPYIPPLIKAPNGILVVDGFLVGNDSSFIKLSRTASLDAAGTGGPERDAFVEIESETGETYAMPGNTNGMYVAPALNLDPSVAYRIHIRTSDTFEYLSDFVPLKESPLLDSVTWKEEKEHDEIQFNIYAHDPLNKTQYYFWTFDETWKYVSTSTSVYYYENGDILPRKLATELYECWKTNKPANYYVTSTSALTEDLVYDFPFFSIPQSSRKLYFGYSILVNQYALTPEAYTYWSITKKNSESLGGLFDPLPSQPQGNIHCITDPLSAVIGYFMASTVTRKRAFFTRQEINGPSTGPYSETGYEWCDDEGYIIPLDEISEWSLQGNLIGDRYYDLITQELIGYTVAPQECVDCRYYGGVTKRPDYWRD